MSWRSLFSRSSSRRCMPVSNTDDSNFTDMDDLMRMADEDYDPNENNNLCNIDTRQYIHHSSHDEPVFHHHQQGPHVLSAPLLSPSSCMAQSAEDHGVSEPDAASKVPCFYSLPKLAFPQKRWYHVLLAIFVIISFVGLNVGLGIYSLVFYYPDKLVIDKSVKSFSIPNHEVYRHFEAMMMAKKDNSSAGRYRRDTSTRAKNALFVKEREMLKETYSMLKPLRQKNIGFFQRKRSPKIQEPSAHNFDIGSAIKSVFERVKRSTRKINCLFEYQSVAQWKMHVIYLADGDNDTNMFTKERLQIAHGIEKKIIEHPGFHNFCLRDPVMGWYDPFVRNMNGCVPLNSLLTYFYPSKDAEGKVLYDGLGENIVDVDSALTLAMNQESFYYYVDDKINKTFQKSHLLRSEVLFGAPLPGYSCISDLKKDQDEKFKDFVVTYINLLSKSSTDKVRVLYGGNEIFDYEVSTSFWSDVRLAIISLVAIFVLMQVLSLSLYLTIVGVVVIAISFPISLFFYRVVFGINALGILNGAAAFVIIGIGVDDVFVYMNIYRQADNLKDPVKRILYTVKTAGVATFFTSFTTAAAFAANIASSIPAVYEFGLFMSLIVSSCWISVFVMMPPTLYLHACYIEPIEKFLLSCFSCLRSKEVSPLHQYSQQQGNECHLYEDDLPMLDVEVIDARMSNNFYDDDGGMDDDDMLLIDDPNSLSEDQAQDTGLIDGSLQFRDCEVEANHADVGAVDDNMCLGLLLQKMMMFLTDKLVIKGRYIVIGFYTILLICSCFLMSKIQPSTHPPELFRPDTNIQQLLNLKANFTIIDTLHCDKCSGIYKVQPSRIDKTADQQPISAVSTQPPRLPDVHPQQLSTKTKSATSTAEPRHAQSTNTAGPNRQDESSVNQSNVNLDNQTIYMPIKVLAVDIYKVLSKWSSSSKNESQPVIQSTVGVTPDVVTSVPTSPPPPITAVPVPQPHETEHHQSWNNPQTTPASPAVPGGGQQPHYESPAQSKSSSVDENFNACNGQTCNNLKDRPLMESGATVYVVFGIKGVDRSQEDVGHVLDQFKGKVIFDFKFAETFNQNLRNISHLRELCIVCNMISNQTDLVKAGSAQCLLNGMFSSHNQGMAVLHTLLNQIPECRDLPGTLSIYQHQAPAHAEGGIDRQGRLLWLAFAFESTTSEGQAYFEAYKQYQKWEKLISHIKHDVLSPNSPLQSMFQTSEFWTKVMMEVVAVNSALYGLVLSMVICVMAVAVFTGHIVLLLIVVVTIIAMICCVVGVFSLAGWEMGAVEAVSLSILVGSSVDYCVHIVEGYILAGKRMSLQCINNQPAADVRRQRTSQAVRHIGVAIVCSALTTIIAAVPLTQTYIQPFAKFGSILLINTTISMLMTLTLAVALLATLGPARYKGGWKAHLIAFVVVNAIIGAVILGLYIASTQGFSIPGPSGNPLFS